MTLWSEFLSHNGRLVHKWRHYFPAYETHFARYVDRPVTVLEIGVSGGGSLQLWRKYFGAHAQIIGIDIQPSAAFEEPQIAVRIGDQTDPIFLQSIIDEFGPPDIIIDDGSHIASHLRISFDYLYQRMSPTGVYFVEDLHTSYWDEFDGGVGRSGTFIEKAKALVDELNADWSRGEVSVTPFTRSTLSLHFYDGCAVFERGRHILPKVDLKSPRATAVQSGLGL